MRLVGTYFDLTDRFAPPPAAKARPAVSGKGAGDGKIQDGQIQGPKGGKVVISVAKRLVPSAVRRNTVKRIVREAWRAANGKAGQPSQQGAEESSARASVQDSPAGQPGAGPDRVCLVRLKRYPGKDRKAMKPKADKRRVASASRAASSGPATAPEKPVASVVTGLAAIKRSLRADADQLFATFLSGRARNRRPAALKNA